MLIFVLTVQVLKVGCDVLFIQPLVTHQSMKSYPITDSHPTESLDHWQMFDCTCNNLHLLQIKLNNYV